VRRDPRDAVAFYRRGQIFARYGEFDRALSDFDEAVRLEAGDPKRATTVVGLASCSVTP